MNIQSLSIAKISSGLSAVALGCCSFLFNTSAVADGILPPTPVDSWHIVAGLGGGGAFVTNLNVSQEFPILDPIVQEFFIYESTSQSNSTGLFEAFLGVEYPFYSDWLLQGGLAYAQTGSLSIDGPFSQGVDCHHFHHLCINQYNFKFNVLTRQLLAQGKFMYRYSDTMFPYFLLGLGGSFNDASGFVATVPPNLTFTRVYKDNTYSSFAFRLGVGVDYALTPNIRLGLAYRFADLGGYQLGQCFIDDILVAGTLKQSNLWANEVLGQITYVF